MCSNCVSWLPGTSAAFSLQINALLQVLSIFYMLVEPFKLTSGSSSQIQSNLVNEETAPFLNLEDARTGSTNWSRPENKRRNLLNGHADPAI